MSTVIYSNHLKLVFTKIAFIRCMGNKWGILFTILIYVLLFYWGDTPEKFRGFFWLCTQDLFLVVLGRLYGIPGIKSGSAVQGKYPVLSLWPFINF